MKRSSLIQARWGLRDRLHEWNRPFSLRLEDAAALPDDLLGEITVVVGPPESTARTPEAEVRRRLAAALAQGEKPREACRTVQAATTGWTGKELYSLLPHGPAASD